MNPNHDSEGKFASGSGMASFSKLKPTEKKFTKMKEALEADGFTVVRAEALAGTYTPDWIISRDSDGKKFRVGVDGFNANGGRVTHVYDSVKGGTLQGSAAGLRVDDVRNAISSGLDFNSGSLGRASGGGRGMGADARTLTAEERRALERKLF
jgi:hypothetical protein